MKTVVDYERSFTPRLAGQSCISISTVPFSATTTNEGENLFGSIAPEKPPFGGAFWDARAGGAFIF